MATYKLIIAAVASFIAGAETPDNNATPIFVTISQAIPKGLESQKLVDVTFNWAFDGRTEIWLDGVGDLPGRGQLRFTMQTSQMIFRTGKNGPILQRLPLIATEIRQTPPLGNPYPSTALGAGWIEESPALTLTFPKEALVPAIVKALDEVQGQHVGPTRCRPDDNGCLVTQWLPITEKSAWTQAQLAVMVVYSAGSSNKSSATIFYLSRQAPIGEAINWDYKISDPIRGLVSGKLLALRARLANGVTGK